jgi:hypothetical protein
MDKKILFFIVAPEKVEFNVFLPPTILKSKKRNIPSTGSPTDALL